MEDGEGRKIFLRRIRTHLNLGRLERGDAADEGGSEERGHSRYLGGVRAGVRTGARSSREEACIHDSSTTYAYNT